MSVTAVTIMIMPQLTRTVRTSPNTVTPKNTAVSGSNAPKMAVGVEPIYCMAWVVHKNDTAVGNMAKATMLPQRCQL